MFKSIFLFYTCLLAGCALSGSDNKNRLPELVNESRSLKWFSEHNVDEVLSLHQKEQYLGLIALSRRGYFYPKIGMTNKPLKLKANCVTWLLGNSSDVVKNYQMKILHTTQQQFAAKFNTVMAPKCLK
jgi:hypothetical protein